MHEKKWIILVTQHKRMDKNELVNPSLILSSSDYSL